MQLITSKNYKLIDSIMYKSPFYSFQVWKDFSESEKPTQIEPGHLY